LSSYSRFEVSISFHFLARRHLDAQLALDQLLFVLRRLQQVEPDRLFRIFGGEPGVVRAQALRLLQEDFSMPRGRRDRFALRPP
jgi:hypothetical protein